MARTGVIFQNHYFDQLLGEIRSRIAPVHSDQTWKCYIKLIAWWNIPIRSKSHHNIIRGRPSPNKQASFGSLPVPNANIPRLQWFIFQLLFSQHLSRLMFTRFALMHVFTTEPIFPTREHRRHASVKKLRLTLSLARTGNGCCRQGIFLSHGDKCDSKSRNKWSHQKTAYNMLASLHHWSGNQIPSNRYWKR